MSPLIITRNGKPVLASTAIGGGLHQRNVQVLAGILEFGMDAQTVRRCTGTLCYPNRRKPGPSPGSARTPSIARFSRESELLGQEVKELSGQEHAAYIGYWAGIQIDPVTGLLRAAGTAELPSYAEGY